MGRSPQERFLTIAQLAQQDETYRKMEADYLAYEKKVGKLIKFLPRSLREAVLGYRGMTYLMGNRKLMIACERMILPKNEENGAE